MEFKYRDFTFDYPSQYLKDVVFIAISGAHSYDWVRKESDLDIRLVWMPDMLQALSVTYRGRTKQFKSGGVDVVSYPIHKYLGLLVKGNGNTLENLFQEKLFQHEQWVKELQEMTMKNLTVKFLHHYMGYSDSLSKDLKVRSRLDRYGLGKLLLSNYRILQAGIILALERKVVSNLREQSKIIDTGRCLGLLEKYLHDEPISKTYTLQVIRDIEVERERLNKLIEKCTWLKTFPTILYDRWLLQYYRGEINE